MSKGKRARWGLVLFGLPFAAVGGFMFVMALVPTLHDAWRMQQWIPVEAEVVSAELKTSPSDDSDDSDTFQAVAHYRYRYDGADYDGHRVAINDEGSDNIGNFQQQRAAELMAARNAGVPVQVWVNPDDPSESVYHRGIRAGLLGMYALFTFVFGGVGIGLIVYGLRYRDGATGVVSPDRPWETRTAWASPEIRASQGGTAKLLWFFALFWCALSAPANFFIGEEIAKGNYAILVILLFDAVGIGLVAAAIHQTISARRFGEPVLRMDPHPGAVGAVGAVAGTVGGHVDVRVPYQADRVFTVTLSAVRTWVSGSGKNRSTRNQVLWQDVRRLYGEPAGEGETRIWFAFEPPAGLPVSQAPSDDYSHWQLRATCELPGVDFGRDWELPVFATGAAGTGTPRRRMRTAAAEEAAAVEQLTGFTQTAGGAAMEFRAGRQWGWGLGTLVFGGIFTAVGIGLLVGGDDWTAQWVIAPVFLLVGLLCDGIAFWMLGNRLRVEADAEGVRLRRWLFGIPVMNRLVRREDIAGVGFCRGSTAQVAERVIQYYDLALSLKDGRRFDIGDGLEGSGQAQRAAEAFATYARLAVLGELPSARPLRMTPKPDDTRR